MHRRTWLRPLLVFIVVCAFAAVDAVVKGHHGGARNAIGNVSAPWALIPFLAGAFVLPRRLALGAFVGAVSTVAALTCYSFVRAVGFDAGGRSGRTTFDLGAAAGNRWFLFGIIGGIALAAAGSWLAARRWWAVVDAVVVSLLVLEPIARILWAVTRGEAVRTFVPNPVVWSAEIFCGCAAAVGFHVLRARYR
jgi:hypothetical protein